ncbi:DedA family protein [Candidatus Planktophila dulcis]|jgi:membrane-associated protein|uniref:DedA family protein n=1 Tax=Candidatus Planktophila dulcis TaxID=1884914 RepID=UPI003CED7758|nr:DedA family protein [Actinomycetota bacterium]
MELVASFDEQFTALAPFLFYVIIGAIVFIETGLLFGFFLPGDSVLFSAGLVAAAQGDINIVLLVTIILAAAFFGDQVGFVIGRVVGRPYLDKHTSPRMRRMIERSERFYEKTGWWAVVAARFFPWIRTFVPPIAGASMMNYYKFLSANIIGAVLWGAGITLAGYYAATLPWVKTSSYAIAAFFICGSIVSGLVNYSRRRR